VDGLNRTTLYQQDARGRITRIDAPEGNATALTYDAMGNITQMQNIPKLGTGLATLTQSAAFPGSPLCVTENLLSSGEAITCTRPLWVKDAKANQTDFTWDAVHGGVLTKTGPADPSGVRPQTRYEYAQLHAWYSNGAGGFLQSVVPIWLLIKERYCKITAASGASCVGGANDEVITEYDYGPNSGPNSLLLRGMVVTASNSAGVLESLRTCYTYDDRGNKVSETKPLANLAVCS
jgi:YD repeat-containing protein